MSFLQTIEAQMVTAMREKSAEKLSVLRMLKTALKNREIELRAQQKELTDEEALRVVSSQVKQLKDAVAEFAKGNRTDLVEKTQGEIQILETFLPAQLTDEEIRAIIADVIANTPNPTVPACMGIVMKRVAGCADGTRVRTFLEQALT